MAKHPRADDLPQPGALEVEHDGDVGILRLLGEHDLDTRPDVETQLDSLVEGSRGVVVDLRDTEFLDASILNLFVKANHKLAERGKTDLVLLVATDYRVKRAVEVSGLVAVLPCTSSRAEAIALANGVPDD